MRKVTSLSIVALATLGIAAPAGAAKPQISLTAAQAKVLKDVRTPSVDGTYAAKCARTSSRKAVCYLVRTSGTSAPCGRGEAKLSRRGRVTASSWGYECASIPKSMWPKGAAMPPAVDSGPAPGPAPAPPVETPAAPAPAAPAAGGLSGTYVCLTGIIAQVRPAGPTSIEPIPVPATGIEPPLKFTLKPDGTYDNITFGAAYANDPKWKGTYTVAGDRVKLITAGGHPLVGHDFVRKTDSGGTEYLIEDAPANESYKANVCRRIS
jgi:hypothetical protein